MLIAKLEGTRVQGLGFRGCREKCENGRERKYNGSMIVIKLKFKTVE